MTADRSGRMGVVRVVGIEQVNQMDDLLEQCNWPELAERYDTALRAAVDYILANHDPVGIIASGTIIRGNPDPTSDLDIYVIHLGDYRQRVQRTFNGIPAEIFINPPKQIDVYFEDEQKNRKPLTAHMLSTGFAVLDRDPVVNELREKAARLIKNPPAAPDDLTIQRYMTALLFEDGMDIVENDPEAAAMILNLAVHEMLQFCFIRAGTFIPRIKSLLTELEKLDPQVTALARDYFRTAAIKDRVKLATSIADLTVEARGFFEWEKHREVLN